MPEKRDNQFCPEPALALPKVSEAQGRAIKSFGRTKGRPLTNRQSELVAKHLGRLRIGTQAIGFDPLSLMPDAKSVWIEIGFGGAEHLIEQAKRNPQTLFIGAEPFMDGIAKAITEIHENNIQNIRIIDADVRPFLENLKDACIERVFLLFPDPWPKARHHKRRIISAEFVETIARILNKGGKFRFASDWLNYAEEGSDCISLNSKFQLIKPRENNPESIPLDHVSTRYQLKKLGDCEPRFFDFERI